MGNMGVADILVLIFVTMISKLVLLTWAIVWLQRKAAADEAWEHENAWDSGWSERDPGYEPPLSLPPALRKREEV